MQSSTNKKRYPQTGTEFFSQVQEELTALTISTMELAGLLNKPVFPDDPDALAVYTPDSLVFGLLHGVAYANALAFQRDSLVGSRKYGTHDDAAASDTIKVLEAQGQKFLDEATSKLTRLANEVISECQQVHENRKGLYDMKAIQSAVCKVTFKINKCYAHTAHRYEDSPIIMTGV